jgi:hypothetical protein
MPNIQVWVLLLPIPPIVNNITSVSKTGPTVGRNSDRGADGGGSSNKNYFCVSSSSSSSSSHSDKPSNANVTLMVTELLRCVSYYCVSLLTFAYEVTQIAQEYSWFLSLSLPSGDL